MVLTFASVQAQFNLTPKGLINTENPEQEFILFDFAGKTQTELYAAALVHLN